MAESTSLAEPSWTKFTIFFDPFLGLETVGALD
jgi:hypothetical protein